MTGQRLIAAAAAMLAACTGSPRAGIGERCDLAPDCIDGAQCFDGVCTPACDRHEDCGGGFLCTDGVCEQVHSDIGDPCVRELDCGPQQSCQLEANDDDGDGALGASCQAELPGAVTGAACAGDDDCRSGVCALGQCSEVCELDDDCPGALACTDVPRLVGGEAPLFRGCLQASGTIELSYPLSDSRQSLLVPVPGNARSFALTAQVGDPEQMVAIERVVDPDGAVLYVTPDGAGAYYTNPIRYAPGRQVTTLLVPNAPHIRLGVGAYEVSLATTEPGGEPGAPAVATVSYRMGELGSELDLNIYFLDLGEHPCAKAFRSGLDAQAAPEAGPLRDEFLPELARILAGGNISLGEITYTDVANRADLDALARDELPALLRESAIPGGVSVFFVRSIDPPGVQALVGGTPGTPGIPGTAASGIALSVETLCYRSWKDLARSGAHAIARHLGLFRNVEPDGHEDPIADSEPGPDNLMYFSEFGGTRLSPGQAEVLRENPVLE